MANDLKTQVLVDKYYLRDANNNQVETTEEQLWARVATAIASVEQPAQRKKWQKQFYWLLENWKFVPGGRVLFGAGNVNRCITNVNCYFNPITADSIEGIYRCLSDVAKTLACGGGCGIDLSILRPAKSVVRNSAMYASGVIPIAEQFSNTAGLIGQHGRSGALLLTLHCNHPDIFEFIRSKSDVTSNKIKYANISVFVTDKLMAAVKEGADFSLWYPDKVDDVPPELVKLIQAVETSFLDNKEDIEGFQQKSFKDGTIIWKYFKRYEEVRKVFFDAKVAFIYNGHDQVYNYDDHEWFVFYSSVNSCFEVRKKVVHKIIKAIDLWDSIAENARNNAEPGILLYDNMRKQSTTEYNGMNAIGTNPCSETNLSAFGACCLGSINLSAIVSHEFTNDAAIDYKLLEDLIRAGVRFLDDVLDYNRGKHPLPQQEMEAMKSRRLGLGVTGLADMLCKLKLKYDTNEAVSKVEELFRFIQTTAYDESVKLGEEKGNFEAFDMDKHFKQPFFDGWKFFPHLRNVAILSMPPVGSGSLLTQTSSGIEPIFAISYNRRFESISEKEFKVYHPLAQQYMQRFNITKESDLPEYFVVADKIDYKFRVLMQSTIQSFTCQSISSTLNCPNNTTKETVKAIYELAWSSKCKGITVYRAGSRQDILSTTAVQPESHRPRKRIISGDTIKVKCSNEHSVYVTLNHDEAGNFVETFVNLGKSGSDIKAVTEAMGRLVSLYLQSGGKINRVIETLIDIRGDSVHWWEGTAVYSMPDAIAKALLALAGISIEVTTQCPQCKSGNLKFENGCSVCSSCGYSKCS